MGIGCLGLPIYFKVKKDSSPVQMPVHRVPVARRIKEKAALQKYVNPRIIVKVQEPTPWFWNKLIRETPKKFRFCIDPNQSVNTAILRPVFQMPTLNQQLHRLVNANCFSLVNIREQFLHYPLGTKSSMMTTMHTSCSRYRCLTLLSGISSAPEEFQFRLTTSLRDLGGHNKYCF